MRSREPSTKMRASDVVALLMASSRPWSFHPPTETTPPLVLATGTRNARDLLDDLDVRGRAWPPDAPRGVVHRGIGGRAERMGRDLEELCAAAGAPVVLGGWSLGGGAVLCLAAHLAERGVPVAEVHVFGAPCVADAPFARWYDDGAAAALGARTYRYRTPRDPVPALRHPLYRHVGHRAVRVPWKARSPLAHHDLRSYYAGLLAGGEAVDLDVGGAPHIS